jgi:hypothetical protein
MNTHDILHRLAETNRLANEMAPRDSPMRGVGCALAFCIPMLVLIVALLVTWWRWE